MRCGRRPRRRPRPTISLVVFGIDQVVIDARVSGIQSNNFKGEPL